MSPAIEQQASRKDRHIPQLGGKQIIYRHEEHKESEKDRADKAHLFSPLQTG